MSIRHLAGLNTCEVCRQPPRAGVEYRTGRAAPLRFPQMPHSALKWKSPTYPTAALSRRPLVMNAYETSPLCVRRARHAGGSHAALAEHGFDAKVLAGGQSLIPVMNFRLAQPAVVVDINRVPGLDFIREQDGALHIGAMVRQATLERDPLVARLAPLIHETMPYIAHPQIRNRGTLGGSLAHADPAGELPLLAVALDARLRLVSSQGERWVTAGDFYQGLFTTLLEPEELLVEIAVPRQPAGSGSAFAELARRHGDYATAGVAAVVTLDAGGTCRAARLVFLNAGEMPMEAVDAARHARRAHGRTPRPSPPPSTTPSPTRLSRMAMSTPAPPTNATWRASSPAAPWRRPWPAPGRAA